MEKETEEVLFGKSDKKPLVCLVWGNWGWFSDFLASLGTALCCYL